jgi:4-amino-4-deoxy-L-arabinose transferase-like glycosyltransferase
MLQPEPVQRTIRRALVGLVVGIGLLFVYVMFQASQFYELTDLNALDYAQVARNLASGEGFSTKILRPLSLAVVPQVERHPELTQAPLHPLWMSVMFKMFGPSARVASWSCGIPFLFTLPLVLWLGWKHFSPKVGIMAMVVLATNVRLLQVAISGVEAALLGFLLTLFVVFALLHSQRKEGSLLLAGICGLIMGLIFLTEYVWLMALVPLLVVVMSFAPRRRRIPTALVFLLGFVLMLMPWMVRNQRVVGKPLFTLSSYETIMGTRSHSGNTLYRSFEEAPAGFVNFAFHHPREIYEKVRDAALVLEPTLLALAGAVMMPFFLVAIIVPLGNAFFDRFRLALYAVLALLVMSLTLVVPDRRLLLPMVPVITLIGVVFFYQLLDLRIRPLTESQKTRWTTVAVVLLLGFHCLPLVMQLAPGRANMAMQPVTIRRAAGELNSLTREALGGSNVTKGPVMTDAPWAVAWFADRPAVWLPVTAVDVRRVEGAIGQVRWLVLTPQLISIAEGEKAEGWARLWERALQEDVVVGGWRVRQRFANGSWILMERIPQGASLGGVLEPERPEAQPGAEQ